MMASTTQSRQAAELSSNNPFRRAVSPTTDSTAQLAGASLAPPENKDASLKRVSTNPFLDSYDPELVQVPRQPSPQRPPTDHRNPHYAPRPRRPSNRDDVANMMNGLSIGESNNRPRPPPRMGSSPASGNNMIPRRPVDEHRRVQHPRPIDPTRGKENNPFNGPGERRHARRRNSESSVMETKEDNGQRREQRSRGHTRDGRKHRQNRQVDLIDKLDVTGIYGPSLFHHDGPFDACNPARNRKGKNAPMQAFPAGSANNVIGGSGPINRALDYDTFHGRTAEGFNDYNKATRPQPPESWSEGYKRTHKGRLDQNNSWDAKEKTEQIHGDESALLGSSTFLDGAPAPRSAIAARRESEGEAGNGNGAGPGLARKRSLAMRIKGISGKRPNPRENGTVTSPESIYSVGEERTPSPNAQSPTSGGDLGQVRVVGKADEKNPFFVSTDGSTGQSSRGDSLKNIPTVSVGERSGRARAVTTESVQPILERTGSNGETDEPIERATTNTESQPAQQGGGFLTRVKSLRGRKTRPERSGSAAATMTEH